jgi:hypothetical protein
MTPKKLDLSVLDGLFTIHRLPLHHEIPIQIYESRFCSISRTEDELSIVCNSSIKLGSEKYENGWACIKVEGPLGFSSTGILADLSTILADAGISIFSVSTFDTDYILVKSEKLSLAMESLQTAGYVCVE